MDQRVYGEYQYLALLFYWLLSDMLDRNFDLTPDEFQLMVIRLKEGDTTLFKQIFIKHFANCQKYLMREYSATSADAYDASMDTIIELRQRLVDGKVFYGNLRYLYTKMASQIFLRKYRPKGDTTSVIVEDMMISDDISEFTEEDMHVLGEAWSRLSPECQELLKLNYYQNLKLTEIAQMYNKPATAIRKQKERCKSHLIHLFQTLIKS